MPANVGGPPQTQTQQQASILYNNMKNPFS
jgi:hypothetical protein